MSEEWGFVAIFVAGFIAAATAIIAPVAIVSHHSTERARVCAENGGAYLHVPETSKMECVR